MRVIPFAIIVGSLLVSACSDDSSDNASVLPSTPEGNTGDTLPGASDNTPDTAPDSTPEPSANSADSARYRLSFNATWSEQTHPVQFPGASAHFSGLIGAVHNEQVIFWEPGQIATDGIEQMAETGGKSLFQTEIDAAIASGAALSGISGGGVSVSPGAVNVEFAVTRDFPQLTLVSMIAPSPDWFVGVHNLLLIEDGEFVDSSSVDLIAYDSGTDSGQQYTSGNVDTQPRDPIARVTSEPSDSSFVDGQPVAGTFVLERLQ